MCIYIYIYVYIERERERDRQIYIICIYISPESHRSSRPGFSPGVPPSGEELATEPRPGKADTYRLEAAVVGRKLILTLVVLIIHSNSINLTSNHHNSDDTNNNPKGRQPQRERRAGRLNVSQEGA